MVKGVNKQVIEVVDTGNPYFERAILIVNSRSGASQSRIYDEAARLLGGEKATKKGRGPFLWLLAAGGFTALGAAIYAALTQLIL